MHSDLVALPVRLLDSGVVGVLMRDEECGLDVAAIGVASLPVEDLLVELYVVVIDGVVESDSNHLWDVLGGQAVRYSGSIFRTETVWENAHCWITRWCSVRVVVVV